LNTLAWRVKRRPSHFLNGIDVWAFLSVEIALLMIFMTYSPPFHHQEVDYAYANNATPQSEARREDAIHIAISRDGNVFLDYKQVRLEDLKGEIQTSIRNGAEHKVYLKADARCMYRDVARVIDELRAANIRKIAFITAQRQAQASN
jgi:biopolymer transport protein ExbD